MKSVLKVIICVGLMTLSLKPMCFGAEGGASVVGGGGETLAQEFISIGQLIWRAVAQKTEDFPEVDLIVFDKTLAHVKVRPSGDLKLDGATKDAISYPSQSLAKVNGKKWRTLNLEQKTRLVFHEFLVLMRVENNDDYHITSQLVLKLSIHEVPEESEFMITSIRDLGFRYDYRVGCINSKRQKGFNPGFLGECGDMHTANLAPLQNWRTKTYLNLRGANFNSMNLEGIDLNDADLRGAKFEDANLKFATLRHIATDVNTEFTNADLRGASLAASQISQAHFDGARLEFANLSETAPFLRWMKGAVVDLDTELPEFWTVDVLVDRGLILNPDRTTIRFLNDSSMPESVSKSDYGTIYYHLDEIAGKSMCFTGDSVFATQVLGLLTENDDDMGCRDTRITPDSIFVIRCNRQDSKVVFDVIIPKCK